MTHSPITFDLPRTFDATEFLSGRLQLQSDDARWLVSTILRKTANRDIDPWGCVRLQWKIMRRIMYEPTMTDLIGALEAGGAVETYNYLAGVRSKGYRLASRYLGDRCVRVPAHDPRLVHRLERERQRMDAAAEEARARWLPIHNALDSEQQRLTIDVTADGILDTLPEHTRLCQDVLVSRLRRRELPFSVSSTGRCFNSITGLKRELRAALRIGGERLGGVDIVCAQPALLALEMARNTPTNGLKKLGRYKLHPGLASPNSLSPPAPALPPSSFASLVFEGSLYECLMETTGLDRDTVKLGFLRDVLAKKGRYPSAVEAAFRRAFPDVHRYIRRVNRDDHSELIRRLQRLESWLVVEQVAPRLVGRVPTITLHDAIFSRLSSLGVVEQAFEQVFGELDFRLRLKREGADA